MPGKRFATLKEDLRSVIGEGFHTMLRKGIDGNGSCELHRYICEMGDDDWAEMLDYWVVDSVMCLLDDRKEWAWKSRGRQREPSSRSRRTS